MANISNLKPFTPQTAAKAGRAGGKASGMARRRKKSIRAALEVLLETQCTDKAVLADMQAAGVPETTFAAAVAWQAVQGAIKGNPTMTRLILDTLGDTATFEARYNKLDDELQEITVKFIHDDVTE